MPMHHHKMRKAVGRTENLDGGNSLSRQLSSHALTISDKQFTREKRAKADRATYIKAQGRAVLQVSNCQQSINRVWLEEAGHHGQRSKGQSQETTGKYEFQAQHVELFRPQQWPQLLNFEGKKVILSRRVAWKGLSSLPLSFSPFSPLPVLFLFAHLLLLFLFQNFTYVYMYFCMQISWS